MDMEVVRSLVRPLVTCFLVVAQVAIAAAWAMGMNNAEPAFAGLGAFTMMAVTFWFNDRSSTKP